jgi:DNA polymerase III subunit delta'
MNKPENLHASIWHQLQERRHKLPHALLLTGRAGIGKFLLARAFVAGLLCEQPHADGTSCSVCQACHWLSQGNHPDFRMLLPEHLSKQLGHPAGDEAGDSDSEKTSDGKSEKKAGRQITIDQIRALDSFFSVGTHRQGLRIVLLYPAESMNRNTANAILKSLEEPPPSTLFLLVTSDAASLLPTIRSRCQLVAVPTPSHAESLAFVLANAPVTENLATVSLALAGGAPLLAAELAKCFDGSWIQSLFAALAKGGQLDALTLAADLDKTFRETKEPSALSLTVSWIQKWVFDLSLISQQQPASYCTGYQEALVRLSKSVDLAALIHFYRQQLLPFRRISDHPVNLRLHLESLFTQYKLLFK